MGNRTHSLSDNDDDFDEEAEAHLRYGDLIMDIENGQMRDSEPIEQEPAVVETGQEETIAPSDQDDPLRFECYGNLFAARPINSYMQSAAEEPPQGSLFGPFWQENELAILFADTGIGKSILSVQIAESIASGVAIPPFETAGAPRRVLLFDFEMDERQIVTRYSSDSGVHKFHFSDELIRIIISSDTEKPAQHRTFTHYIAASIVEHVEYYSANIVIIDNITWLNSSTQSTPDAARMMKILNYLKVENDLSLLVLAHTPKRYGSSPLSLNDLFGSKMLSNFADSIFAMGPSRMGPNTRYLKQLKSRQQQRKYDETNVFTMRLGKMPGVKPAPPTTFRAKHLSKVATETTETEQTKANVSFSPVSPSSFLGFTYTGSDTERDHIGWYGSRWDPSRIEKLYKAHVLHNEGKTQREIAQTLGLSLTTVNRYIAQTKSYADPLTANSQRSDKSG